jgi:hypothetical protein
LRLGVFTGATTQRAGRAQLEHSALAPHLKVIVASEEIQNATSGNRERDLRLAAGGWRYRHCDERRQTRPRCRRHHHRVADKRHDNELNARLDALQHSIHTHPGYQRRRELDAFATSIVHVFRGNFRAVLGLLRLASTEPDLAIELVQNVRKPVVRDAFMGELTRALHNYLASAHSVVDHARRLMRQADPDFAAQWKARVEEALREHPVVHFIGGLRNYSLHRKLPFFGSTFSMQTPNSPEASFRSEIEMSVEQLLEWDRWPAPAKDFLLEHAPRFAVRPLIEEHGPVVYELNVWLHERLMEQNVDAVAEVNEMVVEFNATLMGTDFETARQRMDQKRREGGWVDAE